MGSALLNPAGALEFAEVTGCTAPVLHPEHATAVPATADELRLQVAARLAAHRSRRGGMKAQQAPAGAARPAGARSARIAAAVAERYAQTPSYRAVLAAEAERATQQARAAAEVAALNAQAIAAAQQRLLAAYDEHAVAAVAMELWPEAEEAAASREEQELPLAKNTDPSRSGDAGAHPASGLTVRLYEEAALAVRGHAAEIYGHGRAAAGASTQSYAAEAKALDEEIAFRHAPVFEEPAGPPEALPANLIEFPRQLVAARKARPRYAEGPLREDSAPGEGQLRIFEVDPEQISKLPEESGDAAAQWTSIWLDAPAAARAAETAQADEFADTLPVRVAAVLEPASFARRIAAAAINLAVVGVATAAFAAAFLATATRGLSWHDGVRQTAAMIAEQTDLQGKTAAIAAAAGCVFLLGLYHGLFFWFSTATPGMRLARVAFCTFEDDNPTRRAVRRRMLATLVSACPLGMGYAWAALDDQRLTWHDRMSRMYLRRY